MVWQICETFVETNALIFLEAQDKCVEALSRMRATGLKQSDGLALLYCRLHSSEVHYYCVEVSLCRRKKTEVSYQIMIPHASIKLVLMVGGDDKRMGFGCDVFSKHNEAQPD